VIRCCGAAEYNEMSADEVERRLGEKSIVFNYHSHVNNENRKRDDNIPFDSLSCARATTNVQTRQLDFCKRKRKIQVPLYFFAFFSCLAVAV
jgi:hypothetical protein